MRLTWLSRGLPRALIAALLATAPAHPRPAQASPAQANPAAPPSATLNPTTLNIVYLALATPHPIAAAVLDPPPQDTGLQGARLALSDDATTGRFLQQGFALTQTLAPDANSLLAAADRAHAAGLRIFVVDAPAPVLLALADRLGPQALLLDATSRDDALRGPDCRANILHLLPSRAMLADALMEYLVAKDWRRLLLLTGRGPDDRLYADALRHAATKFQLTVKDDRAWSFNPAAQQSDTGHFQINDEVAKVTQGVNYDVLVVADETAAFGSSLAYRTQAPRLIAGTQGLVPGAWSPVMDEYASTQLQLRFRRQAGRPMTDRDYGGWLAVRAVGEAASRTNSLDPAILIAALHAPAFVMSGYKGPPLSFRPWDGQLRQPVLLATAESIVSISPQPQFLHQTNSLDTLGVDQPETQCHLPSPPP